LIGGGVPWRSTGCSSAGPPARERDIDHGAVRRERHDLALNRAADGKAATKWMKASGSLTAGGGVGRCFWCRPLSWTAGASAFA